MSTTSTLFLESGKVGEFLTRLRLMGVEVGSRLCQTDDTPCKINIKISYECHHVLCLWLFLLTITLATRSFESSQLKVCRYNNVFQTAMEEGMVTRLGP